MSGTNHVKAASQDAVRAATGYLGESRALDPATAYALCSVAADLRIHEVVDAPNWIVGCHLPLHIFDGR